VRKSEPVTDRAFNYYWRREGKRVAEFSWQGKRLIERSATQAGWRPDALGSEELFGVFDD
jgi:hypothetical protein